MTVEKRKYMNINAMTNYELIQQKELKDLKSEGYLLRHKKSGARVHRNCSGMVPIIRISPSASGVRWSTGTPFTEYFVTFHFKVFSD